MKPTLCTLGILGLLCACAVCISSAAGGEKQVAKVDFNRDVRPILSNKCYQCHGPDKNKRQGGTEGLRLDTETGALADLGGYAAIERGKLEKSALIYRIASAGVEQRMPPVDTGKRLSAREIEVLTRWVRQGAPYAPHWSYVKPRRPALPQVRDESWPKNAVDQFILARLEREGMKPTDEADRYTLIRRVSLDLTGLPPTLEEAERFVNDKDPLAYERLVDRLLERRAYGEHWARMWLDLARYADSAGYADDPPRTIWAYRDYVIRSLNANKPFDRFTIEQIAGDLLPQPTPEQLVATAFHRNTLTNNEGGTNDEEFRNVAIVDRVNTTMAVWMGTTIDCAQCHHHKYDPISQEEFFRLFAFFNNTEDSDKRNEQPLLSVWSEEQEQKKTAWRKEIGELEKALSTPTAETRAAQAKWEQRFSREPKWRVPRVAGVKAESGAKSTIAEDGAILVPKNPAKTDVYTVASESFDSAASFTALRLEALAGHAGGNFVVTGLRAAIVPPESSPARGRLLRIEIPGKQKILSLAEVQVFAGAKNIATGGLARQSTTAFAGPAKLAIDGNTNGDYNAKSTTHTAVSDDPWWELDLKTSQPVDRVVLWNRTDNGLHTRLKDFRIKLLDEHRAPVWEKTVAQPPNPSATYSTSGARQVTFAAAYADFTQEGYSPASVLGKTAKDAKRTGWAVSPRQREPHQLTLISAAPFKVPAGAKLVMSVEQLSSYEQHTLRRFRLTVTNDAAIAEYAKLPSSILAILKTPAAKRGEPQREQLARHYLGVAAALKPKRERLASLKKQLAALKPATTVPIMRELKSGRRTTQVQQRGNYLVKGKTVSEGVPAAFHPPPEGAPLNRLTLARWLVDENNPLTARVIANRYWEQIFGVGIVRSSEEFGSQGELPSHPELLDWLATELVRERWDIKKSVKLLVTSAAYRQSSRLTPALIERDPDNRLLARGPRFRLSAEMIRDQALFAGGLLSRKLLGPPVKPPQPKLGISAAFGGGIDWKTSAGDDRYRRGIYTTWRRSNPYPSMATFDAPNREVCTVRRARTNTPLQALVTLNDPVYVEAAQALGRRMAAAGKTAEEKARYGFRLGLIRSPRPSELARLVQLYERAYEQLSKSPDEARKLATEPIGPPPKGADVAELAAWTVVGNVLLNLDETMMKR